MKEYKQVIIVRKDLKLDKGKLAVQVAHGSVEAVFKSESSVVKKWRESGAKKVSLKVEDLKELLWFFEEAKSRGFPASLIKDAGKTHLKPGTITVVGIGPYDSEDLDELTKDLSML